VRCNDASSNLTVELLLCCESPSSSQHQWPCGVSRHDASNILILVLLLYSESTISGQCK